MFPKTGLQRIDNLLLTNQSQCHVVEVFGLLAKTLLLFIISSNQLKNKSFSLNHFQNNTVHWKAKQKCMILVGITVQSLQYI